MSLIPYQTQRLVRESMPFSAIVDINGVMNPKTGGFHVVQDAIDAGHKGIFVRAGTYPKFDVDAEDVAIVGESWATHIEASGSSHACTITAARVQLIGLQASTPSGAGGSGRPFSVSFAGSYGAIRNCYVPESDRFAIYCGTNVTGFHVDGCVFEGCDEQTLYIDGQELRISNNHLDGGTYGLFFEANSDHCIATGNVIKDASTSSVTINAASTNHTIVGNRMDGAATDNNGSSTITGNDTTAF